MRIIGGKFKGREISSPKTDRTRPMTDRDREAVFNILGNISGLSVLDAYAGSGALGFEALSRGAERVEAVEKAKTAADSIRKNISVLNASNQYHLHQTSVESFLAAAFDSKTGLVKPMSRSHLDTKYDVIFADPPFDQIDVEVIKKLSGLLEKGGMLVLKHSSKIPSPALGIKLLDSRQFGDTAISFYRG